MASIFKRPNKRARLGRNGFDMSQRRVFSSSVGMLLPSYTDFANPGDSYRLNSRGLTRTEALQSAAFVRMKAHVDWFFVPITQLYSRWNEFFNMTDDVMSTAFLRKVQRVLPSLPYTDFQYNSSSSYPAAEKWFSIFNVQNDGRDPIPGIPTGETPAIALQSDAYGVPYLWNVRRMLTMLTGSIDRFDVNSSATDKPLCTFLTALAYHKIFHSHYRNTWYTKNKPSLYNIDMYYAKNPVLTDTFWEIMSSIHYRPWRMDYFTMIQPAPVWSGSFADFIGDPATPDADGYQNAFFPEARFDGYSGGAVDIRSSNPGQNISQAPGLPGINGLAGEPLSGFSTGQIRAMFALDKLLRRTAATGSHYDEQTLAHFGYKMPRGISEEAYYLGEQVYDINVNEVVATATTGVKEAGGVIGDIAGKAFGSTPNSNDIKFTAPCHGIIMAIFSIEPIADYRDPGDPVNFLRYSFDFYHPEFDNIGMQPYGYPFREYSSKDTPDIPGWQFRYMQFKTKLDVSHESIYDTYRQTWQASRDDSFEKSSGIPLYARFYIFPQYLNSIFLQTYPSFRETIPPPGSLIRATDLYDRNGNPTYPYFFHLSSTSDVNNSWSDAPWVSPDVVYAGDNFINVVDHKVFKTSVMSVYSLPNS